jgi:hypothetical protein
MARIAHGIASGSGANESAREAIAYPQLLSCRQPSAKGGTGWYTGIQHSDNDPSELCATGWSTSCFFPQHVPAAHHNSALYGSPTASFRTCRHVPLVWLYQTLFLSEHVPPPEKQFAVINVIKSGVPMWDASECRLT